MSFTLVIPTYNRADLVVETIDTALRQTLPFSEIIVIDDGSTDETPVVLDRYKKQIRVIHTANGGVQAARNLGVAAATSDHVTFCDSDDLLEPDFVEKISGWLSTHPECEAAYINFRKFTSTTLEPDDLSSAPSGFFDGATFSGEFVHGIPDLYLRLCTMHPLYITGCTVKKSLFDAIGGFNTKFRRVGAEDSEFTLRVASHANIAVCLTPLGKVRRHPGNDSVDPIYMMLGSATIFEYAAEQHSNATTYRSALLDTAEKLRIAVADKTFANGMFEVAKPIFKQNFRSPLGVKFRMKKMIVNMYEPFRTMAWKMTQL